MAKFKVQGVNIQNVLSTATTNYSTSGVPLTGSVETAGRSGMASPSSYQSKSTVPGSFAQQLKGVASNRRGLFLYKGSTPPVSDVLGYGAAAGSSLALATPVTFRSSDLLLTYPITAVTFTGNTLALTLSQAAATAAGLATWFCLATYSSTYSSTNKCYPCMIVGTITLTNGGGDIELPNVSIISGNIYKMPQLELKIPFSYVV